MNKDIEMDTRCLFCFQRTIAACCAGCRQMNRAQMFENLLVQLGNASDAADYFDQMKAITEQIETVSCAPVHS